MSDRMQIRGGAGPFEAAAVAAVVNHVLESEQAARVRRPANANRFPAWVRALHPHDPDDPLRFVAPDHGGDPIQR